MDFILQWQEKLKKTPTSPLVIKIHNELETLKVINLIILLFNIRNFYKYMF
jgi:hypothetical protein